MSIQSSPELPVNAGANLKEPGTERIQLAARAMNPNEKARLSPGFLVREVLHGYITPVEGLKMLLAREQKPEFPEGLF